MGAAPIPTVHVRQGSAHSIAALAYGKRRRHHTSAGRLRGMLFRDRSRGGSRVQRRAAGLGGCISFLRIRTRPTVAREPSPAVYRAVNTTLSIAVTSRGHRCPRGCEGVNVTLRM